MFSKNCRCTHGSPQFLGSKEESMACALRCNGVTDSGYIHMVLNIDILLVCAY
ncbi:MAG: hypothetical protein P8X74_17815 [Reinekea sp.]